MDMMAAPLMTILSLNPIIGQDSIVVCAQGTRSVPIIIIVNGLLVTS